MTRRAGRYSVGGQCASLPLANRENHGSPSRRLARGQAVAQLGFYGDFVGNGTALWPRTLDQVPRDVLGIWEAWILFIPTPSSVAKRVGQHGPLEPS
jgi:hypothetical protein